METSQIHLLLIDPQNDFCDLPASYCGSAGQPALPVPGAHADMQRVAALVSKLGPRLKGITVTKDSHPPVAIERPAFWRMADGSPVKPFTPISAASVRDGEYVPLENVTGVIDYLERLEATQRYTHMVWPAHCELDTWGHEVHADVQAALTSWEKAGYGVVGTVLKGLNPMTEHYSAVRAEVVDPADPATDTNWDLLNRLAGDDVTLVVAGEAGSHCVKSTVEHILEADPSVAARMVVLTDGISPVTNFEGNYAAFLDDMRSRGAQLMTSVELAARAGC